MTTYNTALIEERFATAERVAHGYFWLSDASQVRDRVDVMLKSRAENTTKGSPGIAELVAMICKACVDEEIACGPSVEPCGFQESDLQCLLPKNHEGNCTSVSHG